MNVHLTADQEALIRRAIDSGRVSGAAELVSEALDLWEARELLAASQPPAAGRTPAEAVGRILENRKGNILPDGVTIRDWMTHGRA